MEPKVEYWTLPDPPAEASLSAEQAADQAAEQAPQPEDPKLGRKRTLLYIAFAFGIAWLFWFAVAYPMAASGRSMGTDPILQLVIGAGMFAPALAVVIVRLITHEGFKGNCWFKPREFRRTWKYYLIGWVGPIVLIILGAALYFLLNPSTFDPSMGNYVQMTQDQLAAAGQPDAMTAEQIRMTGYVQFAVVLLAPLLNCVTCFGEEWGWRGYLLPKLLDRHGMVKTLIIAGIIWGVWHAPITALGHNYGLGYWGFPFTGIGAMCLFTMVFGAFLSWMTLRTGSVLPAVFAHGAMNGTAAIGQLFLVAGAGNAFVGPLPTGIVGGAFLIIAGLAAAVALIRRERAGQPQGPIR